MTPLKSPERLEVERLLAILKTAVAQLDRELDRIDAETAAIRRAADHVTDTKATGPAALSLIRQGMGRAEAIAEVARARRTPPDTVARWLAKAEAHATATARALRDRDAARLARAGLTNAEIAARLNVSRATVSRVLRASRAP